MENFKATLIVVDVTRAYFNYGFNYPPMPESDCRRVLGGLVKVIPEFRSQGPPVIFVRTDHEISPLTGKIMSLASLSWRYQMENKVSIGGHVRRPVNTENSPAMEIMPQLDAEERDIIVHKQRHSAFMGTLLEMYLRVMGVNILFFIGTNTNNCVLCTAFEAYNRDYRVTTTGDCCASMSGEVCHELVVMRVKVSFGWVVDSGPAADIFDGRTKL